MEAIEAILELAHNEQLRQTEFEYVDQTLAQFPIVHTIIQHEMNTRPWQTEPVSPIDALVNTGLSYPELIPTLVYLLETVRHPNVKEALVWALTVKEARGIANEALKRTLQQVPWNAQLEAEYQQLSELHHKLGDFDALPPEMQHRLRTLAHWSGLQFALGNALAVVAQRAEAPQLLEIVRDVRYGAARWELARVLVRWRAVGEPELWAWLQDVDASVAWEAARGLVRLGVRGAREAILARFGELMARHREWRRDVERLLARLEAQGEARH